MQHKNKGFPVVLIIICTLFFIALCPTKVYAKTMYSTAVLYIREKPSTSSRIRGVIKKNGSVEVLKMGTVWYKVKYGSITGYSHSAYLKNKKSTTSQSTGSLYPFTGILTGQNVNLRKKTTINSTSLKKLKKNSSVTVILKNKSWYKVKTSDGKIGYVLSKYIKKKGTKTSAISKKSKEALIKDKAIEYAKTRLGDKYSQGKREKKGYADCSSLVRDAFKKGSGKNIGNTTSAQSYRMKKYFYKIRNVTDATPGDLLYHFGAEANHTAIYLGDGYILHASASKKKVLIQDFKTRKNMTYFEYGCAAAKYCVEH